jgi:2-polyprenyl-3-methyl-5-hydroxy-6-metoxy-1,4-benzoquinol methylase
LIEEVSAPMKMFSKEWYNEYFERAVSSDAHSIFCERVYGRDLCQHGLMDMEELDFLTTQIKPGSKILEIGCSNGFITEYIHERTSSSILGIDFSNVAIEQARGRTKNKTASLQFECVDPIQEEIPRENFDTILLIDSIYFLDDTKESLLKINKRLSKAGKIILSIFQYKEENDPKKILLANHTFLAQALNELGFDYIWFDFTENVWAHGEKNYRVAEELKDAFIKEGNAFLYDARVAENVYFQRAAEEKTITRFMYIIEKLELQA